MESLKPKENDIVKCDDYYGIIRYIGPLHDKLSTDIYVGLQLCDIISNGHNGIYNGKRYFHCEFGYGKMVKLNNINMIINDLKELYRILTGYIYIKNRQIRTEKIKINKLMNKIEKKSKENKQLKKDKMQLFEQLTRLSKEIQKSETTTPVSNANTNDNSLDFGSVIGAIHAYNNSSFGPKPPNTNRNNYFTTQRRNSNVSEQSNISIYSDFTNNNNKYNNTNKSKYFNQRSYNNSIISHNRMETEELDRGSEYNDLRSQMGGTFKLLKDDEIFFNSDENNDDNNNDIDNSSKSIPPPKHNKQLNNIIHKRRKSKEFIINENNTNQLKVDSQQNDIENTKFNKNHYLTPRSATESISYYSNNKSELINNLTILEDEIDNDVYLDYEQNLKPLQFSSTQVTIVSNQSINTPRDTPKTHKGNNSKNNTPQSCNVLPIMPHIDAIKIKTNNSDSNLNNIKGGFKNISKINYIKQNSTPLLKNKIINEYINNDRNSDGNDTETLKKKIKNKRRTRTFKGKALLSPTKVIKSKSMDDEKESKSDKPIIPLNVNNNNNNNDDDINNIIINSNDKDNGHILSMDSNDFVDLFGDNNDDELNYAKKKLKLKHRAYSETTKDYNKPQYYSDNNYNNNNNNNDINRIRNRRPNTVRQEYNLPNISTKQIGLGKSFILEDYIYKNKTPNGKTPKTNNSSGTPSIIDLKHLNNDEFRHWKKTGTVLSLQDQL